MLRYSIDMSEKSKSVGLFVIVIGLLALISTASNAEVEKENLRISAEKPVNPVYSGVIWLQRLDWNRLNKHWSI